MVIPNPGPKVASFPEVDSARTDLWVHHSRTSRCYVARHGEKTYRTARSRHGPACGGVGKKEEGRGRYG